MSRVVRAVHQPGTAASQGMSWLSALMVSLSNHEGGNIGAGTLVLRQAQDEGSVWRGSRSYAGSFG